MLALKFGLRFMRQQGEAACFHVVHILPRNLLDGPVPVFMPDPRLMRQQGQRSWLRAFMLWTSLPLNPPGSHAPGPSQTRFADCSGSVPVYA